MIMAKELTSLWIPRYLISSVVDDLSRYAPYQSLGNLKKENNQGTIRKSVQTDGTDRYDQPLYLSAGRYLIPDVTGYVRIPFGVKGSSVNCFPSCLKITLTRIPR